MTHWSIWYFIGSIENSQHLIKGCSLPEFSIQAYQKGEKRHLLIRICKLFVGPWTFSFVNWVGVKEFARLKTLSPEYKVL